MLRYGAILTRNASLTNCVSLKLKLLPRELSSTRSILTSFRNFHLEAPKTYAVTSKERNNGMKSSQKLGVQNLYDEKDEIAARYEHDATENQNEPTETHHHVRSKDRFSFTDIERMYKNPRCKVHDIYQGVNSELSSNCISYEYKQIQGKRSTWTCNIKVTWPENLTFSSTAISKPLAAHSASLKLLHHLENKRKINYGKAVIYSNEDIKEMSNKPVPLELSREAFDEARYIVEKYDTEIKMLIENADADSNDSASSRHYEACFQAGAILDPVGKSNPQSRLPDRIKERNRLLKARYEDRLLSGKGSQLPITDFQDKIIHEIENNQVVLIKGDTGCGKTTQVPQYIMDSFVKRGQGTDCNIIVAQPRRISATSLAERIATERREQVGDVVGYQVRLNQDLPNTPAGILFCTTGILLRKLQFNPKLEGCSHVIVDEAHERTINTDMLLVLLKRAMELNKELKVIVMSATINADLFQEYFNCNCIEVPGRTFPVTAHYLEDIDRIGLKCRNTFSGMAFDDRRPLTPDAVHGAPVVDIVKIGELVVHITKTKPPGAILVFLPGWAEISQCKKYLESYSQLSAMMEKVVIVPLHSKMPFYDQRRIFDKPPQGVRKIVLATDIAETGITVSDVVYVVDSCTHRQVHWHEKRGLSSISNQWASQANINQRKGRAGRVQPGVSYHFVTREMFERLEPYPMPEVQRSSLEQTVLDAKTYGSNEKAHEFLGKMPQPPDPTVITQAVRELVDLGALDESENLTALGKRIAFFTVHPKLSKALLFSSIFNCVGPMLSISSVMSAENEIFAGILQNKEGVRKVKSLYHPSSDHSSIVWLYEQWQSFSHHKLKARDFCFKARLYPDRMYTMSRVRDLYAEHLIHAKMIDRDQDIKNFDSDVNTYADVDELVRGVLLSGVDQVLHQRDFEMRKGQMKKGSCTFVTEDGTKATITPDSVNFKRKKWPSPYLTYVRSTHSEERRTALVRETSLVSPLTVLLFSQAQVFGYLHNSKEKDANDNEEQQIVFTMKGRKNIRLLCDKETAQTLLQFRDAMWHVVRYMVAHQGLITSEHADQYHRINEFKSQLLQVLGKMLSEAAEAIDRPEKGVQKSTSDEWGDFD